MNPLELTIQWFSVTELDDHYHQFQNIFITAKKKPHTVSSHSQFSSPPHPHPSSGQLLTTFSLWICPLWVFHGNGIWRTRSFVLDFSRLDAFKVHPGYCVDQHSASFVVV